MKRNLILKLLFLLIVTLQSCTNKSIELENHLNDINTHVTQDVDFKNLSKIISVALNEEKGFRKIIKEEALIKFDGDYDILLKTFKKKSIKLNTLKSSLTVNQLLSGYADKLNIKPANVNYLKSSANEYIDYLTNLYPDLQISVPVHAEDWDENYIPKVTFIPTDYKEKETEYVKGYQNQQEVSIDAMNSPDEPVVVIGLNERIIDPGEIGGDEVPVISDWNLQATQSQSGIKLQWTYTYPTDPQSIIGYNIYRKENTSPGFTLHQTVLGINNMVYDDISVEPNKYYSYYVTAFNIIGESNPSNIVSAQAPNRPQEVTSLSATLHSSSLLELNWGIPLDQSVDYVRLEKLVVNVNNDYVQVGDFTPDILYFMDNDVVKGKKVIYRSAIYTANAHSNYKHDFVMVPYRDVSIPTKTYVEKISFDWDFINDIEGWLLGAPEFRLAVVSGSPNQGVTIQEGMLFDFCSRHSWNYFNGRNIYNWQPSNWDEVLTMKVVEWDNSPNIDIDINAIYKKKNIDSTGFDVDGSIPVRIVDFLNSHDEDIGIGYLRYYDPETMEVEFSNYGFKMVISTVDNNQSCYP